MRLGRKKIVVIVCAASIAIIVAVIGLVVWWSADRHDGAAVPQSSSATNDASQSIIPVQPSASPSRSDAQAIDDLHHVYETCGAGNTAFASADGEMLVLESDGQSLSLISGKNSDKSLYRCVADAIEMPDDVRTQIDNDADSAGSSEARWNGLYATWSVSPNSGLDLYVEPQR